MVVDVLLIVLSLGIILYACHLFTNAIEWLGKTLNLSQGVIGSIFSAVGTALPETIIPIIAILFYKGANAHEIGVGAIAGAPFMLSTLAFFVTGVAVWIYSKMGKRNWKMEADVSVFSRDLGYFLVIYGVAVSTTFFRQFYMLRAGIAVLLLLSYVFYIRQSFSDDCENCDISEPLFFSDLLKVPNNLVWISIQLGVALAGIIYGAHIFVGKVEAVSEMIGISPLVLSIIITPIATELPEKFNSVIWIGKKKDTLALGNITGAMVFQSCFPVVFGMLFTEWNLVGITLISALLAIGAAAMNYIYIRLRKSVSPVLLMMSGLFYLVFIYFVFFK